MHYCLIILFRVLDKVVNYLWSLSIACDIVRGVLVGSTNIICSWIGGKSSWKRRYFGYPSWTLHTALLPGWRWRRIFCADYNIGRNKKMPHFKSFWQNEVCWVHQFYIIMYLVIRQLLFSLNLLTHALILDVRNTTLNFPISKSKLCACRHISTLEFFQPV